MLTHTVSFITLSDLIEGTGKEGDEFSVALGDSSRFTWGDVSHTMVSVGKLLDYVDSEEWPVLWEKIYKLPYFLLVDLEN